MPLSTPLPDGHARASSARRTLVGASALASGVLAPLVLAFVFFGVVAHASVEIAFSALWAIACAAFLGARAVGGALDAPRPSVVARAMLAGALYPSLVFAPSLALGAVSHGLSLDRVGGVLMLAVVAAFVGACCGVVFGGMFAVGVSRMRMEPAAHDLPDRAALAGAATLAVAALLVLLVATRFEGHYCHALFYVVLPALGITPPPGTDAAWTRFVVLPAAPALTALALATRGAWGLLRARRIVAALRAGTHPRWTLDETARNVVDHEPRLLALRRCDGLAPRTRVVRERPAREGRDAAGPYRTQGAPIAYVGE